MMIECELCHEWYHGKCLKIARGKVKEDDKYTCPICDWRLKIPRDAARPKLEELQSWHDELEGLPFQPEEEEALTAILDDAQNYRDFIKPIIHSDVPTTHEEIDTLRFHLRKIEGADILLAEETNFLRQELHKWAPVAPEAPPIIQQSSSTRKPRPTKQQKLMASLGITDPEQLPQEFKLKQQFQKKKPDDPTGPTQPPLQPAARPPSASGSRPPSSSTPVSATGPSTENKPFYTALSLHVLESLASAPVVSKMLQAEPHMNREKLYKMKAVLEADRSVWDDIKAFQAKMNALPSPSAHSPTYGYDAQQGRTIGTSGYRDSPLFQTSNEAQDSGATQQPRLGSPAHFGSPGRYEGNGTPPASSFEAQMFHGPNEPMFDSPAHEGKAGITSPDFGGPSGMFDSPKASGLIQAGINSPGFGGSQQSVGHMDRMFADLVNDHENDGIPGLDGAHDVKEAVAAVAEATDAIANADTAPADDAGKAQDVEMEDVKPEEPVVETSAADQGAVETPLPESMAYRGEPA